MVELPSRSGDLGFQATIDHTIISESRNGSIHGILSYKIWNLNCIMTVLPLSYKNELFKEIFLQFNHI